MDEYDGKQFVGIDLHRRRSVIVRQSESGEQLSAVRIINDPVALGLEIERAGPNPEVVLEATYGWLVLGGRHAAGGGRACASGTPVGSQGISVPAGEERRPRRAHKLGRAQRDPSGQRVYCDKEVRKVTKPVNNLPNMY